MLPAWHDLELVSAVQDSASVHLSVLPHELARLALVDSGVVVLSELRLEEVLEVVRLHLLQAHDVRAVVDQLAHDVAPPVVPRERPGGAVRVGVGGGVDLGEDVVREEGEAEPVGVCPVRPGLAKRHNHIVSYEQHAARRRRRRRRDDVVCLERLCGSLLGAVGGERSDRQLKHVADVVQRGDVSAHVGHLEPLLLGRLGEVAPDPPLRLLGRLRPDARAREAGAVLVRVALPRVGEARDGAEVRVVGQALHDDGRLTAPRAGHLCD
mmetsp:Transcript_46096/g.149775  ORF Transcript_46096/g.149775 Transcript_46096/m.149775 type:complete len:267 (+) Transcript_46096:699-1499(+)